MTPQEVEKLIIGHTSIASYARYQEELGRYFVEQTAEYMASYTRSLARHGAGYGDQQGGVRDALEDLVDVIKGSKFPARTISLMDERKRT